MFSRWKIYMSDFKNFELRKQPISMLIDIQAKFWILNIIISRIAYVICLLLIDWNENISQPTEKSTFRYDWMLIFHNMKPLRSTYPFLALLLVLKFMERNLHALT